jgi:ribulose-phosphate 3-epimerase
MARFLENNVVLEPAINVYSREEYIRRIGAIKNLAKIVQFDVIDGIFAQPKNFNDPRIIFNEIDSSNVHLHLMVNDTMGEIKKWIAYRPRRITLHVESPDFSEEQIKILKEKKIEVGIACAPSTALEKIIPFLNKVGFVLLLSVSPGRNGQKFSPNTLKRIHALRERFPDIVLGVDGGIKQPQIKDLVNAGVNSITVGSAMFEGDVKNNFEKFSTACWVKVKSEHIKS